MNNIRCENCRWWIAIKDSIYGECHRYPPPIFGTEHFLKPTEFLFPKTTGNNFCGEFVNNMLDAETKKRL